MSTVDLGYRRGKLRDDAAASVHRIDKQRGKPLRVTSAIRTNAEQEALQRRWLAGGTFNRPPYLYMPDFTPPYEHAKGTVLDTPDIAWMLTYGRAHGWRRPFSYDKVHFEYFPHLDRKRPAATPTPTPTRVRKKGDDDMLLLDGPTSGTDAKPGKQVFVVAGRGVWIRFSHAYASYLTSQFGSAAPATLGTMQSFYNKFIDPADRSRIPFGG